mgnify:CR=1 FL=1
MANQSFSIGQGVVVEVFIDGNKFGDAVDAESADIQHIVEAVADGVLGEGANRFDHIHNGWSINLTMKMVNFKKLTTYLKYRKDVDNQNTPDQVVGLRLTPRANGAAKLVAFTGCSIGGMSMTVGGRTNRNQMKLPIMAQYMVEI